MQMMSDQQRLAEIRALHVTIDKLSRAPKRFTPSAPWIIPAMMIFVVLFALVCLVVKLFMNYLNSKNNGSRKYGFTDISSPDIALTPEDQTSMATTASMRTRDSLKHSSHRARRNRLPPVSLYQLKQKQSSSASVASATKTKTNRAANKAVSKIARQTANRSMSQDNDQNQPDNRSDDNGNDVDGNSPTNISQHSGDTDEVQASHSGLAYGAATTRRSDGEEPPHASNQPEVHVVQIRDLDENVQQPVWPQTESEI